MRAVVQRVTRASVTVGDEVVGSIGPGLCVLVGVTHDDDSAVAAKLADKLWHLRILDDADGVMNLSAADAGAPLLIISQFTLYGDTAQEIGRAHVCTPVTHAHLVCRLLLAKKKQT